MTRDPIRERENGVVWTLDGDGDTTRHSGHVEIYPNWVRVADAVAAWYPLERVQEVHEA